MKVFTKNIPYTYGDTIKIKYVQDSHMGSPLFDKAKLLEYLSDVDDKTYIVGNGDLHDLIIASDVKRYKKGFVPVQISWIDSFSSPREWTGIEDFDFEEHTEKSKQMMSIGYIVHVDEDNVFFADSICPEEKIMYGCMSIPLVAVLDVKVMG